jgi:hypothetical protein
MRKTSLWIAAAALLVTASVWAAGDNAAAPKQLQFNVRMLQGDPLGSVEAGTVRVLADTRLVTLEKRLASLVSGSEIDVRRDGNTMETVQIGHVMEIRPGAAQGGKVRLDITLRYTSVAANHGERTDLHTQSHRVLTTVKVGELLKLRWPGATAEKQVWVELSADEVGSLNAARTVPLIAP